MNGSNGSMVEVLKNRMIATVDESIAAAQDAVVDYAAQKFEAWFTSGDFTQAVAKRLEPTFKEFEAEMAMLEGGSPSPNKGKKSAALPGFDTKTIDV